MYELSVGLLLAGIFSATGLAFLAGAILAGLAGGTFSKYSCTDAFIANDAFGSKISHPHAGGCPCFFQYSMTEIGISVASR